MKKDKEAQDYYKNVLANKTYSELRGIIDDYNNAGEFRRIIGNVAFNWDAKVEAAESIIDERKNGNSGDLEGKVIAGEAKASEIKL